MKNVVVFDLDDTLYKEIDFLNSAFKEIAIKISSTTKINSLDVLKEMQFFYKNKDNVFLQILEKYQISNFKVIDLIEIYRNHVPTISLSHNVKLVIEEFYKNGFSIVIITDGRSIQQRNKIKALTLDQYINEVIISEEFGTEKPNMLNYTYFQKKFKNSNFYFIGDNKLKDFISPNIMGWKTICVRDNGENIHTQNISVPKINEPHLYISDFSELLDIIK